MDKHKKEAVIFSIILILGMIDSVVLLYEHFAPEDSTFCNFGGNMDCGLVNKGPYANLDGISYHLTIDKEIYALPFINISGINPFFDFITTNAFLGFLTLLFMLFLVIMRYKKKDFMFIQHKDIHKWLKGISTFGMVYGLYLFYIQHSVLHTYCPFCLVLDVILFILLILSWRLKE